jgi:hypothetical protein
MDCLAPVAYHASSGAAGITSHTTFAALEASLSAQSDGTAEELRTDDGLVGIWQVWSGSVYAITELDLRNASSGTFRAATDYVAHGGSLTTAWATPGASGGLTMGVTGAVSWPCMGVGSGLPHYAVRALCLPAVSTGPVSDQVLALAGMYSPGTGKIWTAGCAYTASTINEYVLAQSYGTLGAETLVKFSNVVAAIGASPGAVYVFGHSGTSEDGATASQHYGASQDDFALVTGDGRIGSSSTSTNGQNDQSDLRPIVRMDAQSTGDTTTIQKIHLMRIIP